MWREAGKKAKQTSKEERARFQVTLAHALHMMAADAAEEGVREMYQTVITFAISYLKLKKM